MSYSDVEFHQEPVEDRKSAVLLDKRRKLKKKTESKIATTSVQNRKTDEKSTPSTTSPKKKSTSHSLKDQDNFFNHSNIEKSQCKEGGETATPMITALQKRKTDGSGETTVSKKSSLFVDGPKMKKVIDGVRRAKQKQAESVNKQGANFCTLTLDQKIKSIFKILPVVVTKVG